MNLQALSHNLVIFLLFILVLYLLLFTAFVVLWTKYYILYVSSLAVCICRLFSMVLFFSFDVLLMYIVCS